MNDTVFVGYAGFPRQQRSRAEVETILKRNAAAAHASIEDATTRERVSEALDRLVRGGHIEAKRYSLLFGVALESIAHLLPTVEVVCLQEAIRRIGRDSQGAIEIKLVARGDGPLEIRFGHAQWADYAFALVENVTWGPLISTEPDIAATQSPHRMSPRRIAQLLTLTTSAQVTLAEPEVLMVEETPDRLIAKDFLLTGKSTGFFLPRDPAFFLTRASAHQIYDWHLRVNVWENDFHQAEDQLAALVGEATKGWLAEQRHDDSKEIIALGRCLEYMWAAGKGPKLRRIKEGCRQWMADRGQRECETEIKVSQLQRFYTELRNHEAHVATGEYMKTDIERAHLIAAVRGLVQDYIWWTLRRECTTSRPTILSRAENGGSHRMTWSQMFDHWHRSGKSVDEILRGWG